MKHITKSDNEKMVISEKTIVLYDNIAEVQTEDGVQYEADMYVMKNRGITDYDILLAKAKAKYEAEVAQDVRAKRNALIEKADIMVNKALDKGDSVAEAKSRAYRQALRDVPEQVGFPFNVQWPEV